MTRWSLFLQTLSLLHHFLGLYLPQTPILTLGDVENVAGLDMDLSKNGKQDIILWYEDGQARMLLRIGEEVPPVFIALDADSNPTAISALPDDGR